MNVCDTSFERAKTALLRSGDVLDCISVLMEKIRLDFEPFSPGIRASIARNDREPGSRSSSLLDHRQRYCAETHIEFSKPGSTARDLSIILSARQCFYVNTMYLRCSAPRFREIYAFPHSTFDDDPVNSKIWNLALCHSSLSRHEFL